ncbi:helix-turn-helix domain-containing protein [Jhaorihella thermophila]
MTLHHTLADRLRARAHQLGLSPAHVAEMAGVNRSFIYDILRGRSTRPNVERLGAVARVLKVERDWLIHGIGDVEGTPPLSRTRTKPSSPSPTQARARPWAAARWCRITTTAPDAPITSAAPG